MRVYGSGVQGVGDWDLELLGYHMCYSKALGSGVRGCRLSSSSRRSGGSSSSSSSSRGGGGSSSSSSSNHNRKSEKNNNTRIVLRCSRNESAPRKHGFHVAKKLPTIVLDRGVRQDIGCSLDESLGCVWVRRHEDDNPESIQELTCINLSLSTLGKCISATWLKVAPCGPLLIETLVFFGHRMWYTTSRTACMG